MNGLIKKINADKIIKLGTYSSLILLFLLVIYVLILYAFLPPFIPLFNQMPWGQERLGTQIEIFIPVGLATGFVCVNLFLSLQLYEKMPLISRILSITNLLICTITFIFIVRTIRLII